MKSKTLNLLALSAMLIVLSNCGGGGSGSNPPPAQPTTALVKVSLQGTLASGTTIGGVDMSMTLPAGVSVKTQLNSTETASSVVTASGVAATNSQVISTYTSTTGVVRILLANAEGFGVGEVALVNCDISAGYSPATSDFTQSALSATDLNGNIITGLTGSLAVELH